MRLGDADRQMRALEGLQDLAHYGIDFERNEADLWQIRVYGNYLPEMDTAQVHAFLMGAGAIRDAPMSVDT